MLHFNELTPAQAERLALLAEEAGETVQAIGKILRHGMDSDNRGQMPNTNRVNLAAEIGDFFAAVTLLVDAGDLSRSLIDAAMEAKLERIGPHLHHQAARAAK